MVVAFQQRHPDVTLDIDLSDRVVDLGTEEFDLAIRLTDRRGRKIAYISEVLRPEPARALSDPVPRKSGWLRIRCLAV